MGRYYHGDIEGKFWFGVQSSDDADFFGVQGEPRFYHYYFSVEDKKNVHDGLVQCDSALGEYRELLDKFDMVKIRRCGKGGHLYRIKTWNKPAPKVAKKICVIDVIKLLILNLIISLIPIQKLKI